MPETLLSPSSILLYGRTVTDLQVTPAAVPGRAAQLLQGQLSASNARFARIYGFSYEGRYYDLSKPAIFLVHGDGDAAGTGVDARGVAVPVGNTVKNPAAAASVPARLTTTAATPVAGTPACPSTGTSTSWRAPIAPFGPGAGSVSRVSNSRCGESATNRPAVAPPSSAST